MSRYRGPKEKLERRLGERLGLKGERSNSPKAAIVKRPYPPGQHGPSHRGGKASEFSSQLRSKQKVRYTYLMSEKPLKALVKKAIAKKTDSPYQNIIKSLEDRLDNVVFRSGFAQSRDQAHQLVSHGHITVNGKRAKTGSIMVKVGDKIGIRDNSKTLTYFSTLMPRWFGNATPPSWIELDKQVMVATIKGSPTADESGIQMSDLQSIIEFYSR